MAYIHEILGKANIRSVADFLLFGLGPDEDTRNYEERIDELYDKFEDAVKKYDPNPTSELLDLSNEISSETASVYTEIGLQMGILLVVDMAANLRREKGQYRHNTEIDYEADELINRLYQIQEGSVFQEAMYDDKEFQQADKELKIVVEKMQENLSDCRRMDVIQELYDKLECMIRICGRTAYCQGFHDASRLFNL